MQYVQPEAFTTHVRCRRIVTVSRTSTVAINNSNDSAVAGYAIT